MEWRHKPGAGESVIRMELPAQTKSTDHPASPVGAVHRMACVGDGLSVREIRGLDRNRTSWVTDCPRARRTGVRREGQEMGHTHWHPGCTQPLRGCALRERKRSRTTTRRPPGDHLAPSAQGRLRRWRNLTASTRCSVGARPRSRAVGVTAQGHCSRRRAVSGDVRELACAAGTTATRTSVSHPIGSLSRAT